jgi:hypothetical protein
LLQKKLGVVPEDEMLHFPLFLRGVLEKMECRTRFLCGENVVKCVVNVVKKPPLFAAEKWDMFCNYFFLAAQFSHRKRGL